MDNPVGMNHKEERTPGRAQSAYYINIIVLCVVTLAAMAAALFSLHRYRQSERQKEILQSRIEALEGDNKSLYTSAEVDSIREEARDAGASEEKNAIQMSIQSTLESGGSTLSMLRSLFADDLVVLSNGKYYFYPVLTDLAKNDFKDGDFDLDDTGFLTYKGSDKDISLIRGIDVSEENGEIDWQSAQEEGTSFAMVCAGGRDAEGVITDDRNFASNVQGAAASGMSVGVYYNFSAVSKEEAQEDADHLIAQMKNYKSQIHYPVACSLSVPEEGARTAVLKRAEWTDNVRTFCNKIKAAGYTPMIYGTIAAVIMETNVDQLDEYGKWIANYDDSIYYPYSFSMWQYSSSGQVQGITGDTHLDAMIVKKKATETEKSDK